MFTQHQTHYHGYEDDFITNEEVDFRNSIIESVENYQVELNLNRGENFDGSVVIDFKFKTLPKDDQFLQLDFDGEKVQHVTLVDEQRIEIKELEFVFERKRIMINSQSLNDIPVGELVSIELQGRIEFNYHRQKQLIHIFIRRGSKHAQNISISTFDLSASHPKTWKIVSNEPILSQVSISDEQFMTVFHKTIPFPCYMFALCAGDYEEHKGMYNESIMMNTFYRKEKSEYVKKQIQDFEDMTRFGLNYMEEYTKLKYYLKKYDSVYCIDYIYYGMENPGCTTLEELLKLTLKRYLNSLINQLETRYVFEEEREPIKIVARCDIIFHEISHLWFGDCISLKWWNNLFLKEGFAQFFGYKISLEYFKEKHYEYYFDLQKVWILADEKNQQDIYSLSHKRGKYIDYENMKYHNQISYQKGGSLFSLMEQKLYGQEDFQNRMVNLFKANAFKSIGIEEFLDVIKKDDTISRKYIFNKGLSYYDQGEFKDTYDLGLTAEEYQQLKLQFFVISKKTGDINLIQHSKLNEVNKEENIIILNNYDYHLVFQRFSKEDLKAIQDLNIFSKFNQEIRISLWKGVMFESIQFGHSVEHLNFFLQNIKYEENPVVFHFSLRTVPKNDREFSLEQENMVIDIYKNETNALRKKIVLKNLIRYLFGQDNLNFYIKEYLKQSFKIKQKYLDQLTIKLDPKTDDYYKLIQKNK